MKGVVFTEFLNLVETGFGMPMADHVLTQGCPFHQSFTSVGYYDHKDLLAMVGELSKQTGTEGSVLVHAFGKHLFGKFLEQHPAEFVAAGGTMALLQRVEKVIHVEVIKIHPDAELPRFHFLDAPPGWMKMVYQSKRPFATLAGGLIEASIEHFEENLVVEREDLEGAPETHALFTLRPRE